MTFTLRDATFCSSTHILRNFSHKSIHINLQRRLRVRELNLTCYVKRIKRPNTVIHLPKFVSTPEILKNLSPFRRLSSVNWELSTVTVTSRNSCQFPAELFSHWKKFHSKLSFIYCIVHYSTVWCKSLWINIQKKNSRRSFSPRFGLQTISKNV